jgi:hypothetical protein
VGFERKYDETSIVVLGELNPRIFQPEWYARHKLLREQEVEAALEDPNLVISEQVTNFEVGWLQLQVTQNRFLAKVKEPSNSKLLKDLVIGTFELLAHTPARKLGLNRMLHYSVDTEDEWHLIGDTLTPKSIWDGIAEDPGMLGVQLQLKPRTDFSEHLHVKIEPSLRAKPFGVHLSFNEQYDSQDVEDALGHGSGAEGFAELIRREFSNARDGALEIADELLERILVDGDE